MIGEIMPVLEYAIGRILKAKLPRMKNVIGYKRKLILVWSDYFYAEPERVTEVLMKHNLTTK
jgi:hypothetical protein